MEVRFNSPRSVTILIACLLLAVSAFAAKDANKGSIRLLSPATVAGKKLGAGSYTVQWQGSGSQVELQILDGKKSLVSTSARLVSVENPVSDNQVIVVPQSDGSMALSRIEFRKKNFAIEISDEGGNGSSAGGASGAAR